MRTLRFVALFVVSLLSITLIVAKDSWERPFQEWSQKQVALVFNNSPWAQQQDYGSPLEGTSLGQNEVHNVFTVRLFSALPIREAYVRMLQILNHYDSFPPDRRQAFDKGVGGILHADVRDEVIVAMAFSSTDPEASRNIKQFLDTSTTATLSQSAFLFSSRVGRVDLMKYIPPGQEGIGARFIFPRVLNGQPLLQPDDKELRFEFWVAPISQRLLVGFKPSKMMYERELAY